MDKKIISTIAKASTSKIPVIGSFASEFIGLALDIQNEKNIEEKFAKITEVLRKITPEHLHLELQEILSTSNFDTFKSKLELLYFQDSTNIGFPVFIKAWSNNAFDEIDELENQDRLNFLIYITARYPVCDKNMNEYIKKLTLKLCNRELKRVNPEGVRAIDLAALFFNYGSIYRGLKKHKEVAILYIASLEQSLIAGSYRIGSSLGGYPTTRQEILHYIADHLSRIDTTGMINRNIYFEIAIEAAKKSYCLLMTEDNKKSSTDFFLLYWIARQYSGNGYNLSAITYFKKYLDETQIFIGKTESEVLNDSLWSIREFCSYYIMENTIPKPDANMECMCGSKISYINCCYDLLEKST